MRKIFQVMVNNENFDVFDIDGKEHEGYNDTPKTWWIYFSRPLPDSVNPPSDSEYFLPYHISIERHVWDIRVTQRTATKEKWNATNFNNNTFIDMVCNGKTIYQFGTSGGSHGLSFAFAKIQYLMTLLSEHPFDFFNPEKENGRKICWYGMPATIKVKSNAWEIIIIPDYTDIPKDQWWKEYDSRRINHTTPDPDFMEMEEDDKNEELRTGYINWGDALSDQHIYWFRK